MATVVAPPVQLRSLELEITGTCQLACTHCLAESSPQAPRGDMTPADWAEVIDDAATLGVEIIQLIGGEPTTNPHWRDLVTRSLGHRLRVEVYSNLFHVAPGWWKTFELPGVSLGTSYYSSNPDEHDKITGRPGSYVRTRCNIREAVRRGIEVRAGVVDVLPGQHVAEAARELRSMGVTRINVDRARAVGRARRPGTAPSLDEMCGRCTRGRAAILPNGELVGCVLARDFPVGNVRETPLRSLLTGGEWAKLSASIPPPNRNACPPDDSSDCDPASTEACDPAYADIPDA